MLVDKNIIIRKKGRKINSCYLIRSKSPPNISPKTSSLNMKPLSIQELISYSPSCKNKTKVMITRLLSSSKCLMINKKKYSSSISFPKNFRYFYPYKPNNLFISLNSPKREKQNNHFRISSPTINKNESMKLFASNYKKISNKYQVFKNKFYVNKDKKTYRLMSPEPNFEKIKRKICPKNTIDESESEKIGESKLNEGSFHINKDNFMNFIDEMIKNKIHINKCKKYVKEYFMEKKDGNKSFFEDLLYQYKFYEHENENYFLNDDYSTKKNSFNVGNFEISFKITSLQFILYELPEIKQNEQKFDSALFYDIENNPNIKYSINSKIKLPFEFLPIFYGINFGEFINLMISIVEYDYDKNIFFIEHKNFINKIEIGKSLYDFFSENCYFNLHNYKHKKQCFVYDWEVKNKNSMDIKHFVLKILLPQIRINIKYNNEYKIKFFSTIDIQTLGDLMKNSFNSWDLYTFIYFSEFKLFRYEINKILCGKYKTIFNENESVINDFKNNKRRKKISFNLNTINVILNTRIKNRKSYGFFYSHHKLGGIENETYYIKLKIPQIDISLNNSLYSFNKKFDINIKEMSQINKLRRSFRPEDIIKYSMIIIRNKNNIDDMLSENIKPKRNCTSKLSARRSSTVISRDKNPSTKNTKKHIKKDGKRGFSKFNKNPTNEEYIKDIKLNLDNYIFNLDESILKFIKVKENKINKNGEEFLSKNNKETEENNKNIKDILNQKNLDIILRDNKDSNLNNSKIEIEIGTIELSWTDQEALTKSLFLDKKQTEYLLDIPTFKWKFFVEKNIEKILSEESRTLRPIRRESRKNFDWDNMITKEDK